MTCSTVNSTAAHAPNTSHQLLDTRRGIYQIQASWPLGWDTGGTTKDLDVDHTQVIYLVDGNAYFFSATELVRRLQFSRGKKAIVIGIGYPITETVFSPRRRADLTQPAENMPPPLDGIRYGEADKFLEVIVEEIMPFVQSHVFPTLPMGRMPKALFGHSFGGLFSLYTMFTRPSLFETFISASPSIWWGGCSIVRQEERAFVESHQDVRPNLLITFGLYEQYPPQRKGETGDEYEKRRQNAAGKAMKDNAEGLVDRMKRSRKLGQVWMEEFATDDHGSAAMAGLQHAAMKLLGEL